MQRNLRLNVRVSADERKQIARRAESVGLSVSDFIRIVATDSPYVKLTMPPLEPDNNKEDHDDED